MCMKRVSFSRLVFLCVGLMFLIVSCKKEEKKDNNAEPQQETVDEVAASMTANAVVNSVLNIMIANGSSESENESYSASDRKYGCATVKVTPGDLVSFPKTVTVDFGTGCAVKGYKGKGIVNFALSQWVFLPGAEIKPGFDNFYVNGYKVEGDYVITTISADNGLQYKVDIKDGIITFPNGKVYHLKGTQFYEQTKGEKTVFAVHDDMYSITGDIAINSDKGVLNGEIVEPLISKISCGDITDGNIEFKTDTTKAILDFGNGECDKKGTVQIGTSSFPVDFPF